MSTKPEFHDGERMKDGQMKPILGWKTGASHWEIVAKGIPIGANLTAQDIWESACKYFKWCDENPILKAELMRSGKNTGSIYSSPIQRPYLVGGLCLHLGITKEYLYDTAKSQEDNDFKIVALKILEIIYNQKLELGITGVYNSFIISKELGLDNDKGKDKGSPTINISVIADSPKLLNNEQDIDITKMMSPKKPESIQEIAENEKPENPKEQKSNF